MGHPQRYFNQLWLACWQQFMAASVFFEQQPSLQSFPQQLDAVLSLPQSLQHDAAALSSFMQDLPSLPQQDAASLRAQQSLPFACLP